PPKIVIPSAPQLTPTPPNPKALDDLTVTVSNPKANTVYNFEWCRMATSSAPTCEPVTSGVQVGPLFTKLPAADVPKRFPETWRLVVTPTISGTQINGSSATLDIEIADTPSRVQSVSLDKYRVVAGETIQATPTSFVDPDNPDGGGIGLRYQWYLESSPD